LVIGDWAQSPIPNPQSPFDFEYILNICLIYNLILLDILIAFVYFIIQKRIFSLDNYYFHLMISKLNLIFLAFLISAASTIKVQTQVNPEDINYIDNGDFSVGYKGFVIVKQYSSWIARSGGIEVYTGRTYNSRWSATQKVVELDSNQNDTVYQKVNLPYDSNCTLKFDYAAREAYSANTNGLKVEWNGKTLIDFQVAPDNNLHHEEFQVKGVKGDGNEVTFYGQGKSDSLGMTFSNVVLNCQYVDC